MTEKAAVEKTWIEGMKERLDTLKTKLELGKKDFREGVEDLEEDLGNYMDKLKKEIDEFVDENPQAQQIAGRLDEMRVQLALAKADGRDALERETRKLRDKLHAWKWDALDWLKDKSDERSKAIKEALDSELEFYTAQLELLNVRAHLAKNEAEDKWEELRKKLNIKLQELRNKLEDQAEETYEEGKKSLAVQLRKWADRLE
jgi:ElaB/YqjD/DUF883 family membrane-anchored ribosome-binding protein